ADGPLNLLNAVKVAASPLAAGKGVLMVLNDRIGAARHTVKTHTTATDAFSTSGTGWIGTVVGGIVDFHGLALRAHTNDTVFDLARITSLPTVDIVYGYQNAGAYLFEAAINAGAKGIVFAATGNGTLSEAAKRGATAARAHGVVFVRSTRVGGGAVTPHSVDSELDTVAANSLNPQKARILLSLALTLTNDPRRVQTFFDRY
ncbi:MAG: asparaginase domain-containing protein, partial [Burkholderiaceae bacterium]